MPIVVCSIRRLILFRGSCVVLKRMEFEIFYFLWRKPRQRFTDARIAQYLASCDIPYRPWNDRFDRPSPSVMLTMICRANKKLAKLGVKIGGKPEYRRLEIGPF